MHFLPSKKLNHRGELSRLIPKFYEPFEDTVIAATEAENEIKNVLYNIVRELPITLEQIRIKSEKDDFIIKMKKQMRFKEKKSQYYWK